MSDPAEPPKSRFDLSFPQTVAGALAAASAAVAASWLGVAGTVVGAIVASFVASVSTALYKHPLERSSQVIRETLPALQERQRQERASWHPGDGASPANSEATPEIDHLAPARPGPVEGASPVNKVSRSSQLRKLNWRAVLVSAVVTLVAGLAVLTGFETVIGQSVASLFGRGDGGSTVGRIVDKAKPNSNDPKPTEVTPTTGDETSTAPSTDAPTTDAPTTDPPTTDTPTTDPGTDPPTTAPTTDAPTTDAPTTDAGQAEDPLGQQPDEQQDPATLTQ